MSNCPFVYFKPMLLVTSYSIFEYIDLNCLCKSNKRYDDYTDIN